MHGLGLAFALASALQLTTPLSYESLAFSVVPRQSGAHSCGFAVIAGLAKLAGAAPDDAAAIEKALIESQGKLGTGSVQQALSMGDMIAILSGLGIPSIPVRLEMDSLSAALRGFSPLVLHLDKPTPHFVLGLGAERGLAVVADPARGLVAMRDRELASRASGYALLPSLELRPEPGSGKAFDGMASGAVKRRLGLESLAWRSGGASMKGKDEPSRLHAELGVRVGSGEESADGSPVSPGIFLRGLWAPSGNLSILAEAECRLLTVMGSPGKFLFSSGLEWHRSEGPEDRSSGFAIMAALERKSGEAWSIGPRLVVRHSVIADPFLLTGSLGAGMEFRFGSGQKGEAREALTRYRVSPSLSVLGALSPDLACKAALDQSFGLSARKDAGLAWNAWLELGMYMPAGLTLLYAGARTRLDGSRNGSGEVLLSITL